MSERLRQQLNALHQELATVQSVDDQLRQALLVLLADVLRLLDPYGSPKSEADSPVDKLESFAIKFDADHPALSAALRQLMDALGKAGI